MLSLWSRLGRMLLSWTVLMALAGSATYALVILPGAYYSGSELLMPIMLAATSGFTGSIAGAVQRIYLRPYWNIPFSWAWLSGLGWAAGLPLAVGLSAVLRTQIADLPDISRLFVFLLGAAFAGVVSSFGQWLLLRRVTNRHLWWLLANAVGWLMAWILVLAVGLMLGEGEALPTTLDRATEALLLGGLAGFVIGFEQGVAVIGLFAQSAWEKTRQRVE